MSQERLTRTSHDADAATPHPANRLGIDYRAAPARKAACRIVDIHSHVYAGTTSPTFFDVARLYGVSKVVTMAPLDHVPTLRAAYGDRLDFIAIPRWRAMNSTDEFRTGWMHDLERFRELGATRMKFWMAPPMRERHGLTLDNPFFEPVIRHALDLGYHFMVHIGDPSEWFEPGGKYENHAIFGSKRDQYTQLEWLLERVGPRTVIGAHMGGTVENPDFLASLLERFSNYYVDSSATKWVARGVAKSPERVRELIIRFQDRIAFGSDLVVDDKYDFDHYASRYWVHQMMWETPHRGENPIDDPDGPQPPRLAGVDLPPDVLRKFYDTNAAALGY